MSHMLDLTGMQIMSELGKGIGMPGSGCAAAMSALSGTHVLISVCKLTLTKEKYQHAHAEVQEIQELLETTYLPKLERIINADEAAVKSMLRQRIKRDKETDPAKKEEYRQQAMHELEIATATVMDLCDTCLNIIPMALQLYKVGLKSAQGDSAVALNILLAGASSGLFTTLINIKLAKGSSWATAKRPDLEKFFGRLHEYQYIQSGRLAAMYNNS